MNILSYSSFFVGPSTGTLHIANSLDIPHIGIYSPIKVQSAKRWGPFPKKNKKQGVFTPDIIDESDKLSADCMSTIKVSDVCQKIFEILES